MAQGWTTNRNIPVIALVGMLVNLAAFVAIGGYTYATMNAAIAQTQAQAGKNQQKIESMSTVNVDVHRDIRDEILLNERKSNDQAVAIGRVQVGVEGIQKTLDSLDRYLKSQ